MFPWGSQRRINTWADRCKQRFGGRLQKLAVNAGFSCPNRDGTLAEGGCTFCNNEAFNPSYCDPGKPVIQQIEEGLAFVRKRYPRSGQFVAYFQAFSNTHAPLSYLKKVYGEALEHPQISGLVVGTRPDCVDGEKLDYLARLAENYFVKVEYGVESCLNQTLLRIRRGHDFEASLKAIAMTAERGLTTGIHLILGLPGESPAMMAEQVVRINAMPIHTIKFHQLQIVRGTAMETEFADYPRDFHLFELDEYVEFMVGFLEVMRPDISVDRIAGEVPPRFSTAMRWGNIRADGVLQKVEKAMEEKNTWQGRLWKNMYF